MEKKPVKTFGISFGEGTRGCIDYYGDSVVISGAKNISIQKNYVTGLNKLEEKPLSKFLVELEYYDFAGIKNSSQFNINSNDFLVLKNLLQV
ncbi:MAG: hypothetical protein ABH803_00190 [Candidatus Micrarchaeota archaeon]